MERWVHCSLYSTKAQIIKLKILFLSRHQNTVSRGAEVFVEELSRRLGKENQVDIFSGRDSDNLIKIIKGGYDVVIPINGRWQSLKVSLGRFLGGYKVLISGHSGIGRDDIWNILIGHPDIFVALTERMSKWAKGWAFGLKITKIPNGIDLGKFTPNGKKVTWDLPKPIILSVGALVWYKHHDRVIEAVSRLGKGSVVIAGDGPLKNDLVRLAKSKLGNNFLIDKFKYEDLPGIYRSVDLFTLPSWDREAFGIVYLEALASNIPVVAPDDESRREIIGGAGILTDTTNVDIYANVLNKALETNWGDLPRKQAEKFDWDKVAALYSQALNSLKKQ